MLFCANKKERKKEEIHLLIDLPVVPLEMETTKQSDIDKAKNAGVSSSWLD